MNEEWSIEMRTAGTNRFGGLVLCPLLLCIAMVICCGTAISQHGSAENGYYPPNYHGDTWSGEVTAADDTTRTLTLTYRKKDKTETFVGILDAGYKVRMKDGTDHELKVSELSGLRITVYYMVKDEKVAGTKLKVNHIFQVRFLPGK